MSIEMKKQNYLSGQAIFVNETLPLIKLISNNFAFVNNIK
jgi:hypothetical protein